MLALKLLIVPIFIVLITLAARRWGPQVAGMMAGFPLVAGPILLFICIERGHAFAANAAAASVSAVIAALVFGVVYAWMCRSRAWWWSLPAALAAWAATAFALAHLQLPLMAATVITLGALWLAPRSLPAASPTTTAKPAPYTEILARMTAGALLVAAVTGAAGALGSRWSGLMAMFPVLASVLCMFSQRSQGPAYVAQLVRGMMAGYFSFAAFCVTLAVLLPAVTTAVAFIAGLAAAFVLQFGVQAIKRLGRPSIRAATEAA
ncbi:hypothetical protein [Lysobacter tyrosinilyticus]